MKNITKQQLNFFKKKGYLVLDILDKKKIKNFRSEFSKMISLSLSKNLPDQIKLANLSSDPENYILNQGMIALDRLDHKFLVELYNQIAQSTAYYQIVSDQSILSSVNCLLGREENSNLYLNSMGVRMDTPNITPFLLGWHRDDNSNIKNSRFIQFWAPVTQSLDTITGGLYIIEGSHSKKIETTDSENEKKKLKNNKPIRTPYNTEIKGNYEKSLERHLTFNLGQVLFFDKSLMHKSPINRNKDKMRYVLIAFYHDLNNERWEFQAINHKN